MSPYPEWLRILSRVSLGSCFLCATIAIIAEVRRPQNMMIMNFVWPITALYFGPAALWGYFRSGPKMTKPRCQQMQKEVRAELKERSPIRPAESSQSNHGAPTREQVMVATTHCGAGCTLGDIAAEWWVFTMGLTFAGGEFQTRLVLDFLLAWTFGIVFQYFTIVPMRKLSFGRGLFQAMRADTLVIALFEVGLFAWMTLTHYVLFPGPHLRPTEPVFWFMMQIGMIVGFFTSYPANKFLLRIGWKEKMPRYNYDVEQATLGHPAPRSSAA